LQVQQNRFEPKLLQVLHRTQLLHTQCCSDINTLYKWYCALPI